MTGSLVPDGKKGPLEKARARRADISFQVKGFAGEMLMFEGRVA